MNEAQIRSTVLATLKSIAPELEAGALRPDRPLRSQVDLDSMDWLHFIVALHERFGVEIPEADYGRLTTLERIVQYLSGKAAGGSAGSAT